MEDNRTYDDLLLALRPADDPLDAEWTQVTLASILSVPVRDAGRRPRRRRMAFVALLTGAILTGGVAYAAGGTPQFLLEAFNDARGPAASSGTFADGDFVKIADVVLPDDRRFAVWRSDDADGQRCEAVVDDWDGQETPPALEGSCWRSDTGPGSGQTPHTSVVSPSDEPGVITVVYGQSPEPDATSVAVTGPDLRLKLEIDEVTGGYAAVLPPETPSGVSLDVRFLGPGGEVLGVEQVDAL